MVAACAGAEGRAAIGCCLLDVALLCLLVTNLQYHAHKQQCYGNTRASASISNTIQRQQIAWQEHPKPSAHASLRCSVIAAFNQACNLP